MADSYPFTLIFENDKTARPDLGWPIKVAGRKVVKMSIFLTCGGKPFVSSGLESTR
jgi:hypothetical protein